MIPHAPVQARRSIIVNATLEQAWSTLTEVSDWPRWYPYLANAKLHGEFIPGTRLTYGGLFKHHLRIAKVEQRRLVMIYGTLMGYTGITQWKLDDVGGGRTSVTFTESSDGFLIRTVFSSGSLGKHLQEWLERLKAAVEHRP